VADPIEKDRVSVLIVGGMQSASCVQRIEQALRGQTGVLSVGVNLLTRMTTVRHNQSIEPARLIDAVKAAGFEASLAMPGSDRQQQQLTLADAIDEIASWRSRFLAGAILTLILLAVDRIVAGSSKEKVMWLFLLATPVQITVGWEYYRSFFKALGQRRFNMDSLVVLGSTAAYLQGVLAFVGRVSDDPDLRTWGPMFVASAGILTLVSLGKWLEFRSRESANKMWGSLWEMMPKEARVLRDGREQVIPAGVVAIGDNVIVQPGEKIPVDGVILDGMSDVNEALFTGEGRPISKVKGDTVAVASFNQTGRLVIRATGVGEETTLSNIQRMVEDAQTQKAPVQLLADRVSAVLTPAVLLLSVVTFAVWYLGPMLAQRIASEQLNAFIADWSWFSFLGEDWSVSRALRPAIAVLVVACPCVLGLATPMVVMLATGLGARRGILIKGGQAIEAAGRVSDVVFEKSGVLTDGHFKALEVLPAGGVDRAELLNIAASLESCSEHALARGVLAEARKQTLTLRRAEEFEPLPGRGLRGKLGGRNYFLGSRALVSERCQAFDAPFALKVEGLEKSGLTLIFLGEEKGQVLGAIAMGDALKSAAPEAVAELRGMHINMHLLSGDNPYAASAVGRRCGMQENEIHALMPVEDKIDFALQLRDQGRRVAMVGDGINDAPAMAAADVGIALGAGTDIAAESGAIVLVSHDPRGVARALRLCQHARALIHWNLLFTLFFNLVMVPLAMFNKLEIGVAAVALAAASTLVILNSLRLTKARWDSAVPLEQPVPHPSATPAAALAGATGSTPTHLPVVDGR